MERKEGLVYIFGDVRKIFYIGKKECEENELSGEELDELNKKLNEVAQTEDVKEMRRLVEKGADLLSNNGPPFEYTPLH